MYVSHNENKNWTLEIGSGRAARAWRIVTY